MKTVIIDVRSRKEFEEAAYPNSVNIPIDEFDTVLFEPFKEDHIALVCYSGNRASKVLKRLSDEGFENISLMQQQMGHIIEGTKGEDGLWTVDRQFRMALGLLIGAFLTGYFVLQSPASLLILLIVFAGLIYSAVTDNCYLKMMIAAMPWNRETASKSTLKRVEAASV